ncbi:PilZ domain-containing protein [Allopontixanthobacter sp.]|uniref:PilZ domain-containing protein n=1 Tax=Allopontixanthobacter sp. TaxID=2906452 RepID=UPI002ABC18B4|nr:PilZ domain-containing protein [Allopontixanthobacter sp.]MDZ4307323.1 PilZ domain-containing protein [Allopontixanthobacter sp.]
MNSQQKITQHQLDVLDETRCTPRFDISVQGRYRTGNGLARHVPIFEISETGCRFYDRFGRLTAGTDITIKIETIGPIVATVRWSKDHIVGVQFERPIYGPVFEFIRNKLAHEDED